MMRPVAGFDLDGVLSNFIGPYQIIGHMLQDAWVSRARDLSDQECESILRAALNPTLAATLHDPTDYYGDLPAEAFDKIFAFIERNAFAFWSHLPSFVSDDDRLNMVGLNAYYDLHYITSRRGNRDIVREATFQWLQRGNFPIAGIDHIHVVGAKGLTAYTLGMGAFIDDDPGKCASMRMAHVPDVFMQARRYNEGINVEGVPRCTLTEYLEFLADNRAEWE
jgi:hypothetical protein